MAALTRKDGMLLAGMCAGLVVIGAAGAFVHVQWAMMAVLIVGVVSVAAVQLETFRRTKSHVDVLEGRLRREIVDAQRQMELLGTLYATLKPEKPFGFFGGWSVTPEAAHLVVDLILTRRPKLVVECGSGLSTVLTAHALKRLGGGRVISLEHDSSWAEHTRQMLASHGVESWARVVHAPLSPVRFGDRTWQWYDVSALEGLDDIDLLFVDGPPGVLQKESRYPAGPMLFDRLSPGAAVVLDDAQRTDEQAIMARWLTESRRLRRLGGMTSRRVAVLEREPQPARMPVIAG